MENNTPRIAKALDDLHKNLAVIRHYLEADGTGMRELLGQLDIEILKPIREIRLRYGIPYFRHGDE